MSASNAAVVPTEASGKVVVCALMLTAISRDVSGSSPPGVRSCSRCSPGTMAPVRCRVNDSLVSLPTRLDALRAPMLSPLRTTRVSPTVICETGSTISAERVTGIWS